MAELIRIDQLKKHFPVRRGLLRTVQAQVKAVDGVTFSIGTVVINLDASATFANGGPNHNPTTPGQRTCGGDLDEGYTDRQAYTSSGVITVSEKGGAAKLLGELSLAKLLEGTTLELGWAVHPHPSMSEILKEAALAAQGRAIHM